MIGTNGVFKITKTAATGHLRHNKTILKNYQKNFKEFLVMIRKGGG
jgi:hypothetical protein